MKRLLAFVFFLLCAGVAHADEVWAVEVESFTCPGCADFEPISDRLTQEMGGRFAIAALPDSKEAPIARAYYAMRDFGDAKRIRELLYQMLVTLRMKPENPRQLVEWIRMNGVDLPPEQVLALMDSEKVTESINKAVRLAQMANVQTTPSIVFVRSGKVIATVAKLGRTPDVFLQDILTEAQRLGALEIQRQGAATKSAGGSP